MANEELEKLRQRVEKDPLSKLFVPLAEEYRKMGMVDEAISVLLRGLENQPNYMTARVALGKIYLEKKMLKEAKEEFKKVVTVIPDNLFALKKIAEISEELGELDEAIEAYQRITKLNPLDEEAKANLESLKSKHIEQKIPEPPASSGTVTGKATELPATSAGESEGVEGIPEKEPEHFDLEGFMPVTETSHSDEEFQRFREEVLSRSPSLEIEEPPLLQEPPTPGQTDEIEEIVTEDAFFIETPEEITVEETVPLEEFTHAEAQEVKQEASMVETKGEPDFSYPDRLIQEGKYAKAVEVYKKMLSEYPQDKRVMQRLEELKALLRILGKGNELVIEQLTTLLDAIKKRKDEFFRNP